MILSQSRLEKIFGKTKLSHSGKWLYVTCQYCGKIGIKIFRWGKPCVVENPTKIYLDSKENYNDRSLIPFEIDHLIPRIKGGTNDIDNLTLSCRKCNRGKKDKLCHENV